MGRVKKNQYTFDPFRLTGESKRGTSKTKRGQINKEVCDFVLDKVRSSAAASRSPVGRGKWKSSLSKDYAERVGKTKANLKEEGDLMGSLRCNRVKDSDSVTLTILQGQNSKADGHNNMSGRSQLPSRQFIPNRDNKQSFTKDIKDGIKDIIRKHKGE